MQRILLHTLIWLGSSAFGKALGSIERQNPNHVSFGVAQSLCLSLCKSPFYSPSVQWFFYGADGWRSSIGLELRYSASDILSRPIMTLSESFLREFRLWSSVYWGPGFEMLFLFPSQSGRNPFGKDTDRKSEMGLGLNLHLIEHFSSINALELKVSRWRGLGTKEYQGFTYLVSYSHSITPSKSID